MLTLSSVLNTVQHQTGNVKASGQMKGSFDQSFRSNYEELTRHNRCNKVNDCQCGFFQSREKIFTFEMAVKVLYPNI